MFPITVIVTARAGEIRFESRYLSDRDKPADELLREAASFAEDCASRWHKHSPEGFESFNVRIINNSIR